MARSSTRSFRFIETPTTHDVRRIGYAPRRDNPAQGTMMVHYDSGRIYYYAEIARHEYRRLEALARAGYLRRAEVLWIRSIARAVILAAPVARKLY